MDSDDDPKPIKVQPRKVAGLDEPKNDKRKKGPEGKHLTIIGARDKSSTSEQDQKPRAFGTEPDQSFRAMVQRGSGGVSAEKAAPKISKRAEQRAAAARRRRLFRLWPKFARRSIRRFHGRFRLWQILLFYIGLPLAVSVFFCFSLLFRPSGAETVKRIAPGGPTPGVMISGVLTALSEGDRERAGELASRLVEAYPNDPRSLIARGAVFAERQEYDQARMDFHRALEISPALIPAKMNLGELEFAVGNYAEATRHYESVAGSMQTNPVIPFRLYLCFSLTGRYPEALGLIEAGRFRPQSAEWFFVQAAEALRAGKPAEARGYISTAKTLFGKKADAYETSLKKIGWLD